MNIPHKHIWILTRMASVPHDIQIQHWEATSRTILDSKLKLNVRKLILNIWCQMILYAQFSSMVHLWKGHSHVAEMTILHEEMNSLHWNTFNLMSLNANNRTYFAPNQDAKWWLSSHEIDSNVVIRYFDIHSWKWFFAPRNYQMYRPIIYQLFGIAMYFIKELLMG